MSEEKEPSEEAMDWVKKCRKLIDKFIEVPESLEKDAEEIGVDLCRCLVWHYDKDKELIHRMIKIIEDTIPEK